VEVIDREGSWYEVDYRGLLGFIYAAYVAVGGYYEAPPIYRSYPEPFYFEFRVPRHHRRHHDGWGGNDGWGGGHGGWNGGNNGGGWNGGNNGGGWSGGGNDGWSGRREGPQGRDPGSQRDGSCSPGDPNCPQ
jgi:hypothetical protein